MDILSDRISNDDHWILGGDLNVPSEDINSQDGSGIILQNDLYDAWCAVHPGEPGFNCYHKATKSSSKIDYLFISLSFLYNVVEASVHLQGLSDRHIVNLKLKDEHIQHRNGSKAVQLQTKL